MTAKFGFRVGKANRTKLEKNIVHNVKKKIEEGHFFRIRLWQCCDEILELSHGVVDVPNVLQKQYGPNCLLH